MTLANDLLQMTCCRWPAAGIAVVARPPGRPHARPACKEFLRRISSPPRTSILGQGASIPRRATTTWNERSMRSVD